jgi:site-specific DNA recombinase
MAKRQFTLDVKIPAVAYLRRSTNRQERSLDDQRREIQAYADQNGYHILRWYTDSGISGDATERRIEFLQMHKAATNGRDFDVILCWDYSRFGRFDSIEAGRWIHPLRQAGVRLVTVAEGLVDWDCFTGRIMNALHAEGKHSFLTDLSRNVARSMAGVAKEGFLCGQAAPYGYDRMLIDETGARRQRILAGEKVVKPRGWRTTLVPSEDAVKTSTIRWLFKTYAETDRGLRWLADQLNEKGVPSASGGLWYAATLKGMLENQNYTGTFTWAKRREGKYHSVAAGQIRERDRSEVTLSAAGKPLAIDNPREAWIVVEDAHEALIDKELFERVQQKMGTRRRTGAGMGYPTHTRANRDSYLLSGLVFCAHCGRKMHGAALRAKGHLYPKYVCSTYNISGKNNPYGCGCHGVSEDALVDVLVRKIQQSVLSAPSLERLREALRRQIDQRQKSDSTGKDGLKKQIADLDREIERGTENFLRAPADVLDLLGKKLSALKRQRDYLADQMKATSSNVKTKDRDSRIEAVIARLWRLGEDMVKAEPARRREVFRQMVDRIELRFDKVKKGKRVECPLLSGEIYLRSASGEMSSCVNRGDRIRTCDLLVPNQAL